MKITLVRHGETVWNLEGRLQGHENTQLSQVGKDQAEKVSMKLKSEPFDCIISSDLDRAYFTAKQISTFHSSCPLLSDERLRERYFGNFQGRTKDDIMKEYSFKEKDQVFELIHSHESAEPESQVYSRIQSFLDEYMNTEYKHICIVGHGGSGRKLREILMNSKEFIPFGNTAVSIYSYDNGRWIEEIQNDTSHLD